MKKLLFISAVLSTLLSCNILPLEEQAFTDEKFNLEGYNYPSTEKLTNTASYTLELDPITNPEGRYYELQVSLHKDFSDPMVSTTITQDNLSYTLNFPEYGTYFWRNRVCFGGELTSRWTNHKIAYFENTFENFEESTLDREKWTLEKNIQITKEEFFDGFSSLYLTGYSDLQTEITLTTPAVISYYIKKGKGTSFSFKVNNQNIHYYSYSDSDAHNWTYRHALLPSGSHTLSWASNGYTDKWIDKIQLTEIMPLIPEGFENPGENFTKENSWYVSSKSTPEIQSENFYSGEKAVTFSDTDSKESVLKTILKIETAQVLSFKAYGDPGSGFIFKYNENLIRLNKTHWDEYRVILVPGEYTLQWSNDELEKGYLDDIALTEYVYPADLSENFENPDYNLSTSYLWNSSVTTNNTYNSRTVAPVINTGDAHTGDFAVKFYTQNSYETSDLAIHIDLSAPKKMTFKAKGTTSREFTLYYNDQELELTGNTWKEYSVLLPAGENQLTWSLSAYYDYAYIDDIQLKDFSYATSVNESFEQGLPQNVWTSDWTLFNIGQDGNHSLTVSNLSSGENYSTSFVFYTETGGDLSFYYRTDTRSYNNRLLLKHNTIIKESWNYSSTYWRFYTLPLSPGFHTIEWLYKADSSTQGIVYIDNILFTPQP